MTKWILKWLNVSTTNTKGCVMYDSIYMKNSDEVNPQIEKVNCSCQELERGKNGK